MRKALPRPALPDWLSHLTADEIMTAPFPLQDLLQDSLYYPSSAFDGAPIRHLVGNFFSFIYVDYGYSEERFRRELGKGFPVYDLVACRSVTEQELAPNGWKQPLLDIRDGDPAQGYRHKVKTPFCNWAVLQRNERHATMNIPHRFSLLYLCADGVAAFHALYVSNKSVPKAVAIIQPGDGFGGNWTCFSDPQAIFARSVLGNPYGQPAYLLYGGWHEFYRKPTQSCWPGYNTLLFHFIQERPTEDGRDEKGHVTVWAKQTPLPSVPCPNAAR